MRAAISLAPRPETKHFVTLARYRALASKSTLAEALELAEMRGEAAPVVATLKAAVDAGATDTWSALAPYETIRDNYIETLQNSGAFFAALRYMTRAPLRRTMSVITGDATGFVVGEGKVKSVTNLALTGKQIAPHKAVGIVAATEEVFKFSAPNAQTVFDTELRKAVALAADAKFLDIIDAGANTSASVGTTLTAVKADVDTALAAVPTGALSQLVWIGDSTTGKRLTTIGTETGAPAFPDMTPNGGRFYNLPFLVSDAVTSGEVWLIDASSILADAQDIALSVFRHANIEMNDAPDSPSTASTVVVNLWQHDMVALLVKVYFGAVIGRANSVYKLTGVNWGGFSPDSPT